MFTKINVYQLILLWLSLIFLVTSCHIGRKTSTSKAKHTASPKLEVKELNARKDIADYCKTCLGIGYKYAGKDRNGFDCSGFTSYVLRQNDIEIAGSSRSQALQGTKIPISKVQAGDLLFFGESGKISHVALVVDNTSEGIMVVHSTSSKGVILQNISQSSYWKSRLLFARDVIGE